MTWWHDDKYKENLVDENLMLSLLSTVRPPVLSWKWSTAIVVVQGRDHHIDDSDDNDDGNKNKEIDKCGDDDYIGLLGRGKAQADQDQGHQDLSKR